MRDRIKKNVFCTGNDARVLSISNLGLLHVVAKIDSSSGEGLSAGKFSLKSKQFFLLTSDLRVCSTKTKTWSLRFRTSLY